MKTILYATDYSDNSVAALKYAGKMAEQLNNRLVVVHVFDCPTILGSETLSEPFPQLEKDAFKTHRAKLEAFCEAHLGSLWNSPNVQLQPVENKSVLKGILETAGEWHAQMIVVGIIGESALREMLKDKVSYGKMEFKLFFSDDIFESLRTYLGDVNADMVVMLEREHHGIFKKWFRRGLVKKMESYGRVPLLSFREGNHQLFYFSAVL